MNKIYRYTFNCHHCKKQLEATFNPKDHTIHMSVGYCIHCDFPSIVGKRTNSADIRKDIKEFWRQRRKQEKGGISHEYIKEQRQSVLSPEGLKHGRT